MSEHSPEPWITSAYTRYLGGMPWSIFSHPAKGAELVAGCDDEANAERIAACVNALAGIPDDAVPSVKVLLDGLLKNQATVYGPFPEAPMLECFLNFRD